EPIARAVSARVAYSLPSAAPGGPLPVYRRQLGGGKLLRCAGRGATEWAGVFGSCAGLAISMETLSRRSRRGDAADLKEQWQNGPTAVGCLLALLLIAVQAAAAEPGRFEGQFFALSKDLLSSNATHRAALPQTFSISNATLRVTVRLNNATCSVQDVG